MLLIGFYLFMELEAQAVASVNGIVENRENEPLIGANVQLVDTKSNKLIKGTTTDLDGHFSIRIKEGKYNLEISYVGYTKYIASVEVKDNVNLPIILLNEDSQMMETVVITAHSITYNSEGYIAEIYKNPLYKDKDMSEILNFTPGITAVRNIEAYGKNVSKIYLNGRELKMTHAEILDYLKMIEGKNVKKMEVVISSGVEDDAASAGQAVLKITTINPETGGLLSVGGGVGLRKYNDLYLGSFNMQYRINQQWGVYMNSSIAGGGEETGNKSETHFYDINKWTYDESRNKRNRNNYRGVFGVSYDLNKRNQFSLECSYNYIPYSDNGWRDTWDHDRMDDNKTCHGIIGHKQKYNLFNLSFLYSHNFDNESNLEIKADRLESKNKQNEEQFYKYYPDSTTFYQTRGNERNILYTLSMDYERPVHINRNIESKFFAGVKGGWLIHDTYSDYAYYHSQVLDEITSYMDKYKYSENIYAAYTKYNMAIHSFSFVVGLRVEHSEVNTESLTNPERNKSNSYTDLFPQLNIGYSLNKDKGHNLSIGYSKGIFRPQIADLNPLVKRISEFGYEMGNPDLKSFYNHTYSFTATWFNKYILQIAYGHSKNFFQSYGENINGTVYKTIQNGGKSSYINVYAQIPVSFGKWGDINMNGRYSHGKSEFNGYEKYTNSLSWGCSAMIRLPVGFNLTAMYAHSLPNRSIYTRTSIPPYVNVSIRKSFCKNKLNVSLLFSDIFNQSRGTRVESFYDSYYQNYQNTCKDFGFTLNVRYTLRWGQKSMVRRDGSGNSEESSRLGTD